MTNLEWIHSMTPEQYSGFMARSQAAITASRHDLQRLRADCMKLADVLEALPEPMRSDTIREVCALGGELEGGTRA